MIRICNLLKFYIYATIYAVNNNLLPSFGSATVLFKTFIFNMKI